MTPPTGAQNTRAGIAFMIGAVFVFSVQDVISRILALDYNVWMTVMIRYWVFAAFVTILAARNPGGVRATARTRQPWVQLLRALILACEICLAVLSFTLVGLVAHHALFVTVPLIVVALSGPLLGERVGWRRWTAVAVGGCGVLIILRPGAGFLDHTALLPLGSALLFAIYGLLNRYVSRADSAATSFFWTGTVGAVAMTCVGVWFWEPMSVTGWAMMALLSATAITGHWLFIQAFAQTEASALQPFAYLHLPFAGTLGILVFADRLDAWLVVGSGIVVAAGLWSWWRERQLALFDQRQRAAKTTHRPV